MSDEIKGYAVVCSGCIFAEGIPQHGCEIGRLDKFLAKGRAKFDEDTQHYIIKGVCNTVRGEKWRLSNQGLNLVSTVEREVQLRVDFLLYSLDEDVDSLIKRVEQSVNACAKQQKIQPKSIIVVVKNTNINYRELYKAVNETLEPYDIPFQLVRVLDKNADEQTCLEMGFAKCKSQYTAVFNLNHKIPNNLILRLNELINYELERFVLIKPIINSSGMIVTTKLAQYLKNAITDIYTVVDMIAKDEGNEELILSWEDLWNQK